MAVLWTDSAVSVLLEALQSRESLWNTNVPEYKNRDKKKTEYDELLVLLKDELPTVNLAALKGLSFGDMKSLLLYETTKGMQLISSVVFCFYNNVYILIV